MRQYFVTSQTSGWVCWCVKNDKLDASLAINIKRLIMNHAQKEPQNLKTKKNPGRNRVLRTMRLASAKGKTFDETHHIKCKK